MQNPLPGKHRTTTAINAEAAKQKARCQPSPTVLNQVDRQLGILPPLDDSVLNDVFARLDDFSALDGILQAEDNVLDEILEWLDGMQNCDHATRGGKASASRSWPPYLRPCSARRRQA